MEEKDLPPSDRSAAGGIQPGGEGAEPQEAARDWRLTPPSEKRVIRRGAEVELPHVSLREEPVKSRRKKDQLRLRYGYRVEITKDMTRRQGERVSLSLRLKAYIASLGRRREREGDRMDRASWYIAIGSGIVFCALGFLPWFRVSWTTGTGDGVLGSTGVRLTDLGFIGYTSLILAVLIVAIAVLAWRKILARFPVDAGAMIWLLSAVLIFFLLLVLVGNVGLLHGAGKRSGLGSDFLGAMFITKNALISAYLGVVCAIAALTSSLLRLAERKNEKRVSG